MRRDLPTGTVTFLFTDIEGSTRLLEELGAEAYARALAEHRRLLRDAFARQGGVEVDTQGDAFFYAFPSAPGALEAAREGQQGLSPGPLRVRMGLHTGTPHLTEEGYVGADVHLGARIAASAHGGQVVCSKQTRALVDHALTDLGEHRLKDIAEPISIYQLGSERFPPLKTISNTNLPRPASSFVGRERELEQVVSLLRDSARLLTLSGPGGSGKTRLAIEAASELVPDFKSGVFWVGLAALRDPALVTETIAQTLGAKDGLQEHIGERELLVLLDNLEQVVEAAPELASLLEACPNLRLLITSRELLRVRGEVEYAVPPLSEPEAVELFCARSQLEADETIAELCRRLDNLPLAVELAAARTSVLTAAQILERLSQRLDLLKGGRDAEARQQTLRATIAWSYDLLSQEEQRLFSRLSVFAGGCTLEAAAEVAEADLDTLQSLLDKSLLRFTSGRYWMLETIREFAAERVAHSGEADLLLERLTRHLVAVAEKEGAPNFLGRQQQAFARLEPEHPNVRVVIAWALREQRHEPILALTSKSWLFWTDRGHAIEAIDWVNAVFAERRDVPDELWLPALVGAGEVARFAGDLARATAFKVQLLELLPRYEAAEPFWETGALADLADIAMEEGDLPRARAYAERSLALRGAQGLSPARALGSLGEIALREGDLDRAEKLLQDAADGWRDLGHESNYAGGLEGLGEIASRKGDVARAAELFALALRRFSDLGDRASVGECLQSLALIAAGRGQSERAGRLWGAGTALWERAGSPLGRRRQIGELPDAALAAGAAMTLDEAVAYALESID